MSFANACGQALEACETREALAAQAESLGESLWMREFDQEKKSRADRLDSVARMAAGAAHEINNPLAIISGRAQILLHRATEPNDAQALRTIVEQSQRASKVLGDLIQFARPPKPRFEEARIEELIRRVLASFSAVLSREGMTLQESYATDLPAVPVDRHQMEQVLSHLVGNSIDAMSPAGGVLSVSAKPSRDRRSVIIQITDTGHGIPGDIVAHVFDPFFTTREGGGHTGLGLSVCHGVIESHRGSITIHSQPRKETSVTVTLPSALLNTSSAAVPPLSRASNPMVLLADADDELCEVLASALTNRGYAVRFTSDPLEAMAALIAHPIGLVLIDLHLNAIDGAPLWHRIRQRYPNVPLIGLAAQGHAEDIAAATRIGARSCIEKPFGIEALLHELRAVLGSRGAA
jgi:nitrogen-specific signal transduction histidine kinase